MENLQGGSARKGDGGVARASDADHTIQINFAIVATLRLYGAVHK